MTTPDVPDEPEPLQFSLRRMFQFTAVCAVLMALIVAYLPLGLIATFGVAGFYCLWCANYMEEHLMPSDRNINFPLVASWLGMLLVGLTPGPLLMIAGVPALYSLVLSGPGAFGSCLCSFIVDSTSKLAVGAVVSHLGIAALFAPACRHNQAWRTTAVVYLILATCSTALMTAATVGYAPWDIR